MGWIVAPDIVAMSAVPKSAIGQRRVASGMIGIVTIATDADPASAPIEITPVPVAERQQQAGIERDAVIVRVTGAGPGRIIIRAVNLIGPRTIGAPWII